jgi:hypothetical protein
MATRSRIAMEMADGTVKSIYCHWDGYPSNNGMILQECYLDEAKVKDLIELGDISSLGSEVNPTGPHTFNDPQSGVTVAYHRDRGEDLRKPLLHKSVPDFVKSDVEEYGYIFTQEGEWLVVNGHTSSMDREAIQIGYVLSGTVKL